VQNVLRPIDELDDASLKPSRQDGFLLGPGALTGWLGENLPGVHVVASPKLTEPAPYEELA
jgi:hypothetical protein